MNIFKTFASLAMTAILLLSFSNLFAQIPNGGFENWKVYPNTIYETPQNWTDNDLMYQHFDPGYKGITVLKTTQSHSGRYALQMGITADHNDTVNGGIYSTGSVDSLLLWLNHSSAGFPCAQRYATFTGYYIFNSIPGDSAAFCAVLTKWNWAKKTRDTIVNSTLLIGDSHPDYVPFTVPLKYRVRDEVPDTAFIFITIATQSQSAKSGKAGTTLIIDDLTFSGRAGVEKKK